MRKKKTCIKTIMITVFTALISIPVFALEGGKKEEPAKPVEKADLLSKHETVAVFKGLVYRKCMGRTMLCPQKCGHSGEFAQFEIKEYTKYEKPGQYGDAKQKTYLIQVSDFDKKPLVKDSNGNDLVALNKVLKTLKAGDEVNLNWNHLYVTATYPNGTSSKFPRRVIQKIEKVKKDTPPEIIECFR